MRTLPLILLAACSQAPDAPVESAATVLGAEVPADATLPPPTTLTLVGDTFASVETPFDMGVTDAFPEEHVFLLAGAEPGEGPCHRLIGGYCLDITPPIAIAATGAGGPDGTIDFGMIAPRYAGSRYCFQAVAVRGLAGLATGLSEVICTDFCADEDADRDGYCDAFDVCFGPDEVDGDADGICDSLDTCPGGADGADSDSDGVCDHLDACPGFPDDLDENGDGVPDDCESVWGEVAFVATHGRASGCSYDNAHEVDWADLGSMDWHSCMLEASRRKAMLYSNAYTYNGGWSTHRNGDNAMTSNWSTYTEQSATSSAACLVGRDPRAWSDSEPLLFEAEHDGLLWVYEDLGARNYDECQLEAANHGASIISPSVVGLGTGDNYWVNTVHACNTYEWIGCSGGCYSYDNYGAYSRSSVRDCMIGYAKAGS